MTAPSNRSNREQQLESLDISWGSAAARHSYGMACYFPACRSTRVNPVAALRQE